MAEFIIDPTKHFGWAGPVAAQKAWDEIGHLFPQFVITGAGPDDTQGKRFALYECVRKVLGHDTPNYAQETGDCFVGGSLVTLADGTACPIEDVGVGESVLSGTGQVREVDSVIRKTYSGRVFQITAKGRPTAAACTADHQFQRANGTWVSASLLKTGDHIRVAEDESKLTFAAAEITHIDSVLAHNTDVYCFSVPGDRSFLLHNGGYVVHNCVSFGAKNVGEYLLCVEKSLNQSGDFHLLFPPYLYNIGRVLVGKGQMRGQQGSVGSWQAKGCELYGVLRADYPNCPKYSGDVANKWGDETLPDEFYNTGKLNIVRTTAPINDWASLRQALGSGYPCTIASNQGFEMLARQDGFHYPSGSWGHQMSIQLIDDDPKDPYAGILNSWGDVHGQIVDFKTGEKWPAGMLRVRMAVIEHMIQSGECIAYSNLVGFPGRKLHLANSIRGLAV